MSGGGGKDRRKSGWQQRKRKTYKAMGRRLETREGMERGRIEKSSGGKGAVSEASA